MQGTSSKETENWLGVSVPIENGFVRQPNDFEGSVAREDKEVSYPFSCLDADLYAEVTKEETI